MFLLSFLLSLALGLLFALKAPSWGLMDQPGERKVHHTITPRTGGLAMVAAGGLTGVIGTWLGLFRFPGLPWQTWLAGGGFILVGALDDRFSFQPRQKFGVLLLLAVLAAWPWWTRLQGPGFTGIHLGPWVLRPGPWPVGALLTLWFMALPNAVNIEDAINGYIGGFTLILLGALAIRGLPTWILLGALTGFVLLNWPKAMHFMGDAGSLACGFVLAEGILRGGGFERPLYALILTAPMSLDVAMGLLRRRRLRMSLFTPDQSTLPHHLLQFFRGSALPAAGLLWLNALVFVVLAPFPVVAGSYALLFVAALVLFNRNAIFPL